MESIVSERERAPSCSFFKQKHAVVKVQFGIDIYIYTACNRIFMLFIGATIWFRYESFFENRLSAAFNASNLRIDLSKLFSRSNPENRYSVLGVSSFFLICLYI